MKTLNKNNKKTILDFKIKVTMDQKTDIKHIFAVQLVDNLGKSVASASFVNGEYQNGFIIQDIKYLETKFQAKAQELCNAR